MAEISFTVTAAQAGGKGVRLDRALAEALAAGLVPDAATGDQGPLADDEDESGLEPGLQAVPEAEGGTDPACAAGLSRESLKKAVQAGLCTRNGAVCTSPSTRLRANDVITLTLPELSSTLQPEDGPVDILWQDRDIVVCNKQAGLTVHPCPSCPSNTLIQRLLGVVPELAAMGGQRPGIVHRLDKETSGILLVARNESSRLALSRAFAERRVHKEYLAFVAGVPQERGSVAESIGRDPERKVRMACVPVSRGGREAATDYERLWTTPDGTASLVRVRIHTGRTHQIRVHMAHLGHPLLGDALYADRTVAGLAPRVMLHAWRLVLTHPLTGRELEFRVPPPQEFRDCLLERAFRTQCLVLTGNPGSGKSTVRRLMQKRGLATISADDLVRGYYERDGEITAWLVRRFGVDMLAGDGCVDRNRLMACFEQSAHVRHEVEELAHRLVLGDIRDFFAACCRSRLPRAVAEIPLYFECGWDRDAFDPHPLSLGVRAGRGTRRRRLNDLRGWSEEKIDAIEGWQWDEERKLAACDLVIDNTGSQRQLERDLDANILPALEAAAERGRRKTARLLAGLWGPAMVPDH